VYVEIGCYAGASACLMLQKDNIQVVSIDLGTPIHEDTVIKNVKKLNVKNNSFTYLKGNSQSKDMVRRLQNIVSDIDILFIDGDHSKEGVMNDFLLYHEMVILGGYIVFDDYNDHLYSPEVKPAVNIIVENFLNYEAIGTIKNELKARPETSIEGNCFIMRKIK
jgi:predicted O-methyltransferase YrrM